MDWTTDQTSLAGGPPTQSRVGHQLCPNCDGIVIAPEHSSLVDERVVRHSWCCEECGTEFTTSVSLRLGRSARYADAA